MTRLPTSYTTTVPVSKTVAQCQALLFEAGAPEVTVTSTAGTPTGLAFTLPTPYGLRRFLLPVRHAQVAQRLKRIDAEGGFPARYSQPAPLARLLDPKHALKVAWRNTLDWLEVQLNMIATDQVTADEVMIGFMLVDPQRTVYAAYTADQAALPGTGSD